MLPTALSCSIPPRATSADNEMLRVLRPRGVAIHGDDVVTKPVPDGADDWSHPYHGPDNNPQSDDQLVRGTAPDAVYRLPQVQPDARADA